MNPYEVAPCAHGFNVLLFKRRIAWCLFKNVAEQEAARHAKQARDKMEEAWGSLTYLLG